jgi:uncharacterized protein (TIGR02449 family)
MNVVTDQSEQLDQLARRVDDLIALTELLTTENRVLRAQQQQWSQGARKADRKKSDCNHQC